MARHESDVLLQCGGTPVRWHATWTCGCPSRQHGAELGHPIKVSLWLTCALTAGCRMRSKRLTVRD